MNPEYPCHTPFISLHWLPVSACNKVQDVLAYKSISPNIKVIIKSQNFIQCNLCAFSVLSPLIKDINVCLCVVQTQYPSFIPEIDSSKNSKQLAIKGTNVSTSEIWNILWFKIPSSYLAGHEVDRAPERAKGSHRHWGGIEKKKKADCSWGLTSGAQFPL